MYVKSTLLSFSIQKEINSLLNPLFKLTPPRLFNKQRLGSSERSPGEIHSFEFEEDFFIRGSCVVIWEVLMRWPVCVLG